MRWERLANARDERLSDGNIGDLEQAQPLQAAVDAHRATEYFKALGRKMGEYMDGRAEVLRFREVE